MSATDTPTLRLHRASAQVFVTDFARAITFYRTLLGFDVVFTYGEPPFYGEVRRGEASFNLRHVDESPFVADVREREQLLSASIVTTNAKELFGEFEAAGVDFQERLQLKPWGSNEFVVRDPDGNLILFGTPSAPPPPDAESRRESPPTPVAKDPHRPVDEEFDRDPQATQRGTTAAQFP
ncbi:VOC family protein [Propionibacteriaceae bacterium Y1685]|uniref:VOC family protein n=1 Tax=Microlunatus sp. Y1700 TaxID=3418487 RepID=UPI003B7A6AB8